jgi:hypothetical protein
VYSRILFFALEIYKVWVRILGWSGFLASGFSDFIIIINISIILFIFIVLFNGINSVAGCYHFCVWSVAVLPGIVVQVSQESRVWIVLETCDEWSRIPGAVWTWTDSYICSFCLFPSDNTHMEVSSRYFLMNCRPHAHDTDSYCRHLFCWHRAMENSKLLVHV